MNIEIPPHYENGKLESFDQVRQSLPDDGPNEDNWIFVGTSGVHGSYTKLDRWPEQSEFTTLIVRPRLVSCLYGHIEIPSEEDYHWLRDAIEQTLSIIQRTQPVYEYKQDDDSE